MLNVTENKSYMFPLLYLGNLSYNLCFIVDSGRHPLLHVAKNLS